MTPLVSVIVPAFNAGRYIDATLASILAQGYAPLEIIVVDDGSTDDTPARVRAYGSRVRYYRQNNSGGCSKPRNLGIDVARGDVLSFFDSDDLMCAGRVARHVDFLGRHPDVGLVFSNYRRFSETEQPGSDHFSGCPRLAELLERAGSPADGICLSSSAATELLLSENFGSAMITARREVFARAGRYDETVRASEDFDMQYRIAECFSVGVLPEVDWHKRMHAASMTSSTENILKWKIRTREQILQRETDPARQRALRQTLGEFHAALAYYYSGQHTSAALAHAYRSTRLTGRPRVTMFARIAVAAVQRHH
jgi:glycosyltransferase involved in cell wall biosynthesis